LKQVRDVTAVLNPSVPAIVSVFAGRIADTGKDPEPAMRASKALLADLPKAELLWASVREVLNIIQADNCGCDIVTVPHDILKKAMALFAMDLEKLSLDTVKMFAKDAELARSNPQEATKIAFTAPAAAAVTSRNSRRFITASSLRTKVASSTGNHSRDHQPTR